MEWSATVELRCVGARPSFLQLFWSWTTWAGEVWRIQRVGAQEVDSLERVFKPLTAIWFCRKLVLKSANALLVDPLDAEVEPTGSLGARRLQVLVLSAKDHVLLLRQCQVIRADLGKAALVYLIFASNDLGAGRPCRIPLLNRHNDTCAIATAPLYHGAHATWN